MGYRDGRRPRFLTIIIGAFVFALLNIPSKVKSSSYSASPTYKPILIDPLPDENVRLGIPGTNGQIIYRDGYALLHDGEKNISLWVSYFLTKEEVLGTLQILEITSAGN